MASQKLERQLRALRGEHAQSFSLQYFLQAGQVARLVVDDEHGPVRRGDLRPIALGRRGLDGAVCRTVAIPCHIGKHLDMVSATSQSVKTTVNTNTHCYLQAAR